MHIHTSRALALVASLSYLVPLTASHSWVEQLILIAPNGTFVGEPGFPRGFVPRDSPQFGDPAMTYQLPSPDRGENKLQKNDNICKETQRTQNQTEGSDRLQASPGAAIALRYQENGHVTLPDTDVGKPKNRGSIYVYGTTDPRPDDSLLSIHKVWNAEGTGGDRRGLLLSTQNYDDGRCYQVNGESISTARQDEFHHEADKEMGADLWCQQDIALPQNVPVEKPYTLYWVWDWPTEKGADPGLPDGKEQLYTTCMDVDIVAESKTNVVMKAASEGYVDDQPLNKAAIPSQVAGLDRALKIPDSGASTTPSTDPQAGPTTTEPTSSPSTPTPTGFTTIVVPLYPDTGDSTSTPSAIMPIGTGAVPTQPAPSDLSNLIPFNREGEGEGHSSEPRTVSANDAVYEEYQRRSAEPGEDGSTHDTSDMTPPAYRSPRFSNGTVRRRFFGLL